MGTSLPANDFDAFYAFLGELRTRVAGPISPEESVQRFRESQEQLRKFQELNEIAAEQSRMGMSKPLDLSTILNRVEQRVADQGLIQ